MNKNQISRAVMFTAIFSISVSICFFTGEVMVKAWMPDPEWNYSVNPGDLSDQAHAVAVDSNDNIIAVGFNSITSTDTDWLIIKLNSTLNQIWNYTDSITSNRDRAYGVAVDSDNNITAAGYDSSRTSTDSEWRIRKLDGDKNLLWDNVINFSDSSDMAQGIAVDKSDSSIIVVGHDREDLTRDEWRIMKFDKDKNLLWNKTFDPNPTDNDRAYAVAVDSENNITAVGYDRETGSNRWLIIKLNSTGDQIWNYTSTYTGEARGVAIDSSDNIITAGYDNELGSNQWKIIKLDKDKNLLWNKTFPPNTGVSYAYDVAVDKNNHIIIVGRDNEPGYYQWRTMKLNSTGDQIWNYTEPPSAGAGSVQGVAVDSENNIIAAGYDREGLTNDQWRVMKFKPNVLDGFSCTVGNDCLSGFCIEGYCRSACSDTYDGKNCSNSTNRYDSDGICTRIDGGWECDKIEASLYNGDYWNDCDKTVDNQECDPDSLAGGYYQDGYCQGSTCCLSTDACYLNSPDCDATDSCISAGTWRDYNDDNLWDTSTIEDCTSSCECFQDFSIEDTDLIQDACDNCVGSDRWNIGGEVSNCCGDDTGEYKIDSTYNDSIDGPPASTDACCDLSGDCVHSNNCNASGNSYPSVDSDSDTDYCLSGVWYDCNSDADCGSGQYCDNNDKDCKPHYLIVESIELSYWNTTHWVTPGSSGVSPREGDNRQMNVTVKIQNSTTVDPCSIRVFNSTDSYSNPSIGPFFGTVREVGSQIVCNSTWDMEYWRNPGQWNVSVNLSDSISNFTSTNFTYTELYSIYINVSTINFTGLPGETVNSTSAYPLSMKNIGNVRLNVSINGTDFIGETDPSKVIGVKNISYNESKTGDFMNLTYDNSLVFSFLAPTVERYLYFRDYIPIGFKAQFYNNTIGIKREKA